MDKYFIFKSNDIELAAVDLYGISNIDIRNHQECLVINQYHSEPLHVVIENEKDRIDNFLRLILELNKLSDLESSAEMMVMNMFSGKTH